MTTVLNFLISLMIFVSYATSANEVTEASLEPEINVEQFKRKVAITIDDLPTVGARSIEQKKQLTELLIKKLVAAKVPAIGFVNEAKLGKNGPKPHNVAFLQAWVDAGMELGNHTYSHPKFFDTSLEDYQEEVLLGERVTKALFTPKPGEPRYFRHPYLSTGPDTQTKLAFEEFLMAHNYKVAPVTIDNSEWIYSKAYNIAAKSGDSGLKKRIGEDYIRYMMSEFDFYEVMSQDLFGREIAHTLLLHANQINADYIDQLFQEITNRGYEFVTIHEALKDPAYQYEDNYIGSSGMSWLQRWWITDGNTQRDEPKPSDWVNKIAFDKN